MQIGCALSWQDQCITLGAAAGSWRCRGISAGSARTGFHVPAASPPLFRVLLRVKLSSLRLSLRLGVSAVKGIPPSPRSEEHTSELQSPCNLVCRLLLEK